MGQEIGPGVGTMQASGAGMGCAGTGYEGQYTRLGSGRGTGCMGRKELRG